MALREIPMYRAGEAGGWLVQIVARFNF